MKSAIGIFFFSLCMLHDSFAQNLVPNPSFETFNPCPSANSQIANAAPWDRPPGSITTPDLFNACNAGAGCNDVRVPTNFAGTLGNPFHGSSYAGVLTYYVGKSGTEYITAPFTTPLVAGTQYCVSFRIMRGSWTRYATNNMGAYISNGPPTQTNDQNIPVTPQIEMTTVVKDSAAWTLIVGTYLAVGGETNITIGNFHNTANTTLFDYGPPGISCILADAAAYYFIDSVFVGACAVVLQPPIANFSSSDTVICSGSCINFTDLSTNNPTSWTWNFPGGSVPSSTSPNPSNICWNTPGTYSVTLIAENANGSDTDTVAITVTPPPIVTASPNISMCTGSGPVNLSVNGANTYVWSPATNLSCTSCSNPQANPGTNTTYMVTGTDINGCINDTFVTVTITPVPVLTISGNTSICGGNVATLTASGGVLYSWNPGGQTSATVMLVPSSNATYTITTNANGCSKDTIVTLTVSPTPTLTLSNDTSLCPGQTTTLTAGGGVSYIWNPGGQTSSSITATPSINTIYSVNATGTNGCSNSGSIAVTVFPLPIPLISGNTSLCIGNATTLAASGGTSYIWNPGGQTTVNIVVNPSSSGTYTLSTGNAMGCTKDTSIQLSVSSPPIASANSVTICSGSDANLIAMGGGNYLWSNGYTTSSIFVTPSSATSYSVSVSVGGCSDTAYSTVTMNTAPIADAGTNLTIIAGQSITLTGSGGGSYSWIPSADLSCSTCQNLVVSPDVTTDYCLYVTDANGCSDSSCVTVFVEIICGSIFLPNAFSPNNDNENDILYVYGSCIEDLTLTIYNRWGEKVFISNDQARGWDGMFRGNPENTAVFTYTLKARMTSGKEINEKGNVSLIR